LKNYSHVDDINEAYYVDEIGHQFLPWTKFHPIYTSSLRLFAVLFHPPYQLLLQYLFFLPSLFTFLLPPSSSP
jgi:hypothetical protein